MGTIIKITPPNGLSSESNWEDLDMSWDDVEFPWESDYTFNQETINAYESCVVNASITERAGSFSVALPFQYEEDISRFTVGCDVEINQNGHVFRGWVMEPPIARNGVVKTITLSGSDYTAKTQKIIVTESYTNVSVSTIVDDLFQKYAPWVNRTYISTLARVMTIRFPDSYLWDAMEQICNLTGFDWFIDENLDLNFFETATSTNPNVITKDGYKRGTANFKPDTKKLVNKLWVKGAKALSLPFTQNIAVSGTTPIGLYYTPRFGDTDMVITIGGVVKTIGTQNIDNPGTKDFLINHKEKLIIPDLCVAGSGTIVYRYEYPIKIYLEDSVSISTYGEFEDVITVDIEDQTIAREVGLRYLEKYSKPIVVGSLEPMTGIYHCGELLKVEIPSLYIDEYLIIKSVSYESIKGEGLVNVKLDLENTQKDLTNILKGMEKRLRKIETVLFGDNTESLIEKYNVVNDTLVYPKLTDDGATIILHDYVVAGSNIVGGVFTI